MLPYSSMPKSTSARGASSTKYPSISNAGTSVLVENGSERWLVVKGAPEDILRLSAQYADATGENHSIDDTTRTRLHATHDGFARDGFRVLGIACRKWRRITPRRGG